MFVICFSSFLLKVPEDLLDYLRSLNAGNDFYMPSTVLSNFNINIEDSLKALHPLNGAMPLFMALFKLVCISSFWFAKPFPAFGWRHLHPMFAAGCKDSVESSQVDPRLEYQSR